MVADFRRLRFGRTGVDPNTRILHADPPGTATAWAHASWDKAPVMGLHAMLGSDEEARRDITL
jgi:hypothetical protein